jgi:hypothetical protein
MQLATHSCSEALGKEHSLPGQVGVGVGLGPVEVEVRVSMAVVEVVVSTGVDDVGSSQGMVGLAVTQLQRAPTAPGTPRAPPSPQAPNTQLMAEPWMASYLEQWQL